MSEGNKKYKCLLKITTWDKNYLRVKKTDYKMIYIEGKDQYDAIQNLKTYHTITRVWEA